MRIVHKSDEGKLSTNPQFFSSVSRIIRLANPHEDAKMVFDMKKASKADGNLTSVYAALNFNLNKSRNSLRILPRKACGTNVGLQKDLFGYFSTWENEIERTFESGATRVYAFDPHDYDRFNDYLFHEAFRKDWKRILPCHYKWDIKGFLRELFCNASEHSNSNSPIFISSAYDGEMLRFTIIDCGEGFFSVFSKITDIVNDGHAISWAMNGVSVKGDGGKSSLKSLGDYCTANEGELYIISGGASVLYDKEGFHRLSWLPGAFRGSIINLSVKIKLPEFLAEAA